MRDYYEPRLLPRLLAGKELPEVRPLGDLNRVRPRVEILPVKAGLRPDLAKVTVEVSPIEGKFEREGKTVTRRTDVFDLRLFREGQLVGQEPELRAEDEARLKNGVVLSDKERKDWQQARRVNPIRGRLRWIRKRASCGGYSRCGSHTEVLGIRFSLAPMRSTRIG